MPRESVWGVRLALGWLVLASLLGAAILTRGALRHPEWGTLIPLHAEIMLFGWTMQLAFGIAHWILPRPKGRAPWAILLVFALLNAGLLAVMAGWVFAGRVLEASAAVGFALQAAPRITASGWGATGRGGDLVRLARKVEMP